ncbi:hypothetical protein ACQEVZ_20950 [Dactylosporangium sp. CA-152071]
MPVNDIAEWTPSRPVAQPAAAPRPARFAAPERPSTMVPALSSAGHQVEAPWTGAW